MFRCSHPAVWLLVSLGLALPFPLAALVPPEKAGVAAEKAFRHPDLTIPDRFDAVGELPVQAAEQARQRLAALGVAEDSARVDRRSGRFVTLTPSRPLLPGTGRGNSLAWRDLGLAPPRDPVALEHAAGEAFARYLGDHARQLRVDPGETSQPKVTAVQDDLVQIFVQRTVAGIPVRGSYLNAVIGHGNLMLLGTHRWGDLDVSIEPAISLEEAMVTVKGHAAPLAANGTWGKAELILLPLARGRDVGRVSSGRGYTYRLAWSVKTAFEGEHARFEALVDAHTGELLAFQDTNHYAEAKGGVYPVTNAGAECPGWPMPFLTVTTVGSTSTTDSGGNFTAALGNSASTLSGPFVRINDNCGAILLNANGDLDFGVSGGTDCVTPGFGGAGNTHAARTGFYELNRIKEMGRGQLPGNTWLTQQLTSNTNINSTCNAFWNGSTVNFYRSGGGCANTGEIAGIFDHEWGHGMDANDATPGISSPSGEGIADIYTALRLNDSCIGRNFRPGIQCGGYGDPCVTCTGVRDIDWAEHALGQPHDYSWANANCGGSAHCIGYVYSEAVWDLWKRTLPVLFGMDDNTAHEVVTRLTYVGAGATATWFSGGPPFGGCAANSGYMNYLSADDDNGNLNDGTPHMTAIFTAFDGHEIACGTPTVQDFGCAGTPTAAPTLTATPFDQAASLSWPAVPGASSYEVFRTDSDRGCFFSCTFGKTKIGATAGTTFNDSGLQNGRDYSYVVIPKGPSAACFGLASACVTVQPEKCLDFACCVGQYNNNVGVCNTILGPADRQVCLDAARTKLDTCLGSLPPVACQNLSCCASRLNQELGSCTTITDPNVRRSCEDEARARYRQCVGALQCTVDDNFESGTATGWFNDPASTCTTGAYVLGNPALVTNSGVTTQVDGSFSGVYSIFTATNSSAGIDDVDGGNCILGSPTWNITNASTLAVAHWHGQRDAGNDPAGDFFLLEYSADGGASWNTLASNGDSTSNATWSGATAPIPAGSQVQLRMQCSDGAGPGDLVECGLDDVAICSN